MSINIKSLVVKSFSVMLFAAIGAGGAIWFDKTYNASNQNNEDYINSLISNYVKSNSQSILEEIAKNDNFGTTIKNFSTLNESEIENLVIKYLEENTNKIVDEYLKENDKVLSSVENNETLDSAENDENSDEEKTAEENLFMKHWDKLSNPEVAPFIGPKDAKVTVVEFFDFNCGHCKSLAPIMSQLVKENPDVKFVFNPLYFMSEHSPYAAKVSLAAFKKGKFEEIYAGLMTLPQLNEDSINQIITDEGLDVDEIKKMIEEKDIRRGIQDIDSLSQVLGINGVPMLVINGEAFYGRSYSDLQNKLNSLK